MKYADRIKDTTMTTGTGSITLAGSAPTGHQTFASAFTTGQKNIPYLIDNGAGNWESGIGTLSAATTLTRDSVFASSNSGSKVNFSAGTKTVIVTLPASVMQSVSVNPDDVGFDIVLLAGQSNMKGDGTLDSLIDVSDSRVWQWGVKSSDSNRYQKITQAIDPLSFNDSNTGKNGPGCWFGRSYAAAIPAHRHVLLIPAAVGGTGLLYGSMEWAVDDTLYTESVTQANAAIAAALSLYPNSRFVGICWIQGEAESSSTVYTKADYKTAFSSMLSGFRADIDGATDAWCVIGSMVPEFVSSTTNGATIDAAHQELAGEVSKVTYVAGPSGVTADNVHYNAAGCRIMGARMGIAVESARLGLSYTPPAVTGVTMTGPSSGTVGVASTNFTVGVTPGGGSITGTVVVTPSDGGGGGTFTPTTVSLSSGAVSGTFTYTPASTGAKTISVTNNGSLTNPGNITYTASAAATAPAQVTALTLNTATATTQPLTWTAPSDGGSAITDYVVQWSPAGANTWTTFADGTSTTAAATVTGLTASTSYDYRVAAVNAIGTGSYSSTATGSTAAGSSETTFNSSDQVAGTWTLSGSDFIATRTSTDSGSFRSIRGTAAKSSGKLYFTMVASGTALLGVGNSSAPLNNFVGLDANGWGCMIAYSAPAKLHDGSNVPLSGVSTDAAHTWGIGVDFSTGEMELFEDGTSKGVIYSVALGGQLSGSLYPMCSASVTSTEVTLDCTPASVPSGYTAWG